jgi:hypothetical protein
LRALQKGAAVSPKSGIRLRGRHPALDCVFKKFRVCFDVQCLHHPVLVKRDRAKLDIDNIGHFFHRHSFCQKLKNFALSLCNMFFFAEGSPLNMDPGIWCANGCVISHTQFTGLQAHLPNGNDGIAGPACDSGTGSQGNCDSTGDTAITFGNNSGAPCGPGGDLNSSSPKCDVLTNTTITYNQIGDQTPCTSPANVMVVTGGPGYNCAGIQFYASLSGVTVEYNNFVHLEEGHAHPVWSRWWGRLQ